MQATEFRKLVNRVVVGIKVKELRDLLSFIPAPNDSSITPQLRSEFSRLIYSSIQALGKLNDEPETSSMLSMMQLNEVFDSDVIRRLIGMLENSSTKKQMEQNNPDEKSRFYSLYAALDNFLRLQTLVNNFLTHEETAAPNVVELRIFDFDNSGISPEDLSRCMQAFKKVVESLQRVYNIQGDIKIVAIESGTDTTIWAQVGPIVDSVNKFLHDAWQLIVFNKINKFDRKIESIAKTVIVIADIEKQVENKAIDRDAGEALKKVLLDGAKEMFDCQMFPASANVEDVGNAKKLLLAHKETLLLTDGKQDSSSDENS